MLPAMKLNLSADEVLSTTRSVRKRLDLARPVPREVILEALELALQAPTGSNSQGWSFMFVEDPEKKRIIADYYGANFDAYTAQSRTWPEGDPRADQHGRVRDSATYLREHFHEVPVLLIPLIEGRLDGASVFQGASAWGSILPAVWSFMLALRERGLGSAWTTLHLPNEREVAELLGIPHERYSQAGLFPIAYTLGTDFKPAKRIDTTDLVHWDTW
jgi:nitroreductase